MSKTLCLLRHAKSSWDGPAVADRERALNERGRRDAPRMGAALAGRLEPLPIHASPAARAQLTLEGLQEGWPALREQPHLSPEALYTFSAAELIDYIRGLGRDEEDAPILFLLGHNPGLTELANWACGSAVLDNLPTAGFVRLELAVADWPAIERGCGQLAEHLFPRELAAA